MDVTFRTNTILGTETAECWAPKWGGTDIAKNKPLQQYMDFYTDSYKTFTKKEKKQLKMNKKTKYINIKELQERGRKGR